MLCSAMPEALDCIARVAQDVNESMRQMVCVCVCVCMSACVRGVCLYMATHEVSMLCRVSNTALGQFQEAG